MIESEGIGVGSLCVVPPLLGLGYALYEYYKLRSVDLFETEAGSEDKADEHHHQMETSETQAEKYAKMMLISSKISEGASAYLNKQAQYLIAFIIGIAVLLGIITGVKHNSYAAPVCFLIGAFISLLCGYIGMQVAVFSNVRTTYKATKNLNAAFQIALKGGTAMGFTLVSLAVLSLYVVVTVTKAILKSSSTIEDYSHLFEAVSGFGLGGSFVALFARVGGGIYTKAADVGADLSGKNDFGIDEDDPRNPACIADNVGDNVGDVAGMGADLFGSFAESTCAALVIASSSPDLIRNWGMMMYPLILSSVGILGGIVTMILFQAMFRVHKTSDVERGLKIILIASTIIMSFLTIGATYLLLPAGDIALTTTMEGIFISATRWSIICVVLVGLWSGLLVGIVTEYFTSHSYSPVRRVAETQATSAATGIISGLALGYNSVVIPIILLGICIGVANSLAGMYGIALGAIGMLSTLTLGLTIDAYGPISDNAGGIAEMSNLGPTVRERTDTLDAAGNTTAAIGKGFAIGSAALVSLALFGAFCVRVRITHVDLLDPWTFIGLIFGAMIPYWFSAMTMTSVGDAAVKMVEECVRQFPDIISGAKEPDYGKCIRISTQSAIREMIAPGVLVVLAPIVAWPLLGLHGCAGLLCGILASGIQLAISAANSGGAWDNAKKYIESGGLPGHAKGSQAHKNAVTGDTVGDPLKDTSGPSLNILVKLSAIIALVVVGELAGKDGPKRPFWLPSSPRWGE